MANKTSTSTYQPGRNINDIQKLYGLKKVIKLASNENPLGPSKKAISAANKIVESINRYPDSKSIDLKSAILKNISKRNITVNNIIIGNGSNEILELVARKYLNNNSEVLFCKHSFLVYKIISNTMKAKIIESKPIKEKGKDFMGIDLESMKSKITNKTKVIFIANPGNPTGTIVPINEIESFIRKISKKIIVVIDEAYYEYSSHHGFKNAVNLLAKYSNIVVTRSFSKIYALAGIRVGYGLASKDIISEFDKIRQPFNVNYIAQKMAIASLGDEEYLRKSLDLNDMGMQFLKLELNKLGIVYLNTYTNFITIHLGSKTQEIYEILLSEGVILRPLENYGLPGYLRVTIGTKEENNMFIRKLKKSLKGLK
jgi:histidinol-phosphate aminotransferase